MTKTEIIETMKERFVTREELRGMLGLETDNATREWMRLEVKKKYPVICMAQKIGYKIATSEEDLEMAKRCSRENHRKAATLHRNTNVLDKWIISTECAEAVTGTLPFAEEIRQITANV